MTMVTVEVKKQSGETSSRPEKTAATRRKMLGTAQQVCAELLESVLGRSEGSVESMERDWVHEGMTFDGATTAFQS